jgi:tetratricopeptide (TPR) repeat protein
MFQFLQVAFIQAELGRVIQLNGDKEFGIGMMRDAVDVCKVHMDNEACLTKKIYISIKYAQMLATLGNVLSFESPSEESTLDKALNYLQEALELQDATHDEKSINRIRTLYYIGTVYQKKEDIDQAEKKMTQSLQLVESIDRSHPFRASICTGLGRLLQEKSPEKAEMYMKDAFFIRRDPQNFSSASHWKVAFAYRDLGAMKLREGLTIDAFDYFMEANNMFVRLIERESLESRKWLESRSSLSPDLGIDIIDRWRNDQRSISMQMTGFLSEIVGQSKTRFDK